MSEKILKTEETFEERRGKYILSAESGENDNVHICFRGNSYFDMNDGRATFSITFSDDAKDVYFDMKYCEVRPIGDYDKMKISIEKKGRRVAHILCGLLFVQGCLLMAYGYLGL